MCGRYIIDSQTWRSQPSLWALGFGHTGLGKLGTVYHILHRTSCLGGCYLVSDIPGAVAWSVARARSTELELDLVCAPTNKRLSMGLKMLIAVEAAGSLVDVANKCRLRLVALLV